MELWLPWQHIAPIDLTWKNLVITLAASIFFQIAFIVTAKEDRHKMSVKFDFGLNGVVHSGVTCP